MGNILIYLTYKKIILWEYDVLPITFHHNVCLS